MTPLEQATQATTAELKQLREDLRIAWQNVKTVEEREAILKGRIESMEAELLATKERSDHYLQWAVEITKQLHNVGMFVSDAMHLARQEVRAAKGNGRDIQKALDAVEEALTHGDLQREAIPRPSRGQLPNNEVR